MLARVDPILASGRGTPRPTIAHVEAWKLD
jgi:hypothetical protein